RPRDFSGRLSRTSLKRCYRRSKTCLDRGSAIRSWREVVESVGCPALRGYPLAGALSLPGSRLCTGGRDARGLAFCGLRDTDAQTFRCVTTSKYITRSRPSSVAALGAAKDQERLMSPTLARIANMIEALAAKIRDIKDFPKQGIVF